MHTLQQMGQEVARLRRKKGLTQGQLGDLVGMGQSTIARFENGGVPEFGASKLMRLLGALGYELTTRVLTGEAPELKPKPCAAKTVKPKEPKPDDIAAAPE